MQDALISQLRNPVLSTRFQDFSGVEFVNQLLTNLIGILLVAGIVIFFFMLMLGAVEWISSGGDMQKVANARKRIENALIGLLIIFFIFVIIRFINSIFDINIGNIPPPGPTPILTPTPTPSPPPTEDGYCIDDSGNCTCQCPPGYSATTTCTQDSPACSGVCQCQQVSACAGVNTVDFSITFGNIYWNIVNTSQTSYSIDSSQLVWPVESPSARWTDLFIDGTRVWQRLPGFDPPSATAPCNHASCTVSANQTREINYLLSRNLNANNQHSATLILRNSAGQLCSVTGSNMDGDQPAVLNGWYRRVPLDAQGRPNWNCIGNNQCPWFQAGNYGGSGDVLTTATTFTLNGSRLTQAYWRGDLSGNSIGYVRHIDGINPPYNDPGWACHIMGGTWSDVSLGDLNTINPNPQNTGPHVTTQDEFVINFGGRNGYGQVFASYWRGDLNGDPNQPQNSQRGWSRQLPLLANGSVDWNCNDNECVWVLQDPRGNPPGSYPGQGFILAQSNQILRPSSTYPNGALNQGYWKGGPGIPANGHARIIPISSDGMPDFSCSTGACAWSNIGLDLNCSYPANPTCLPGDGNHILAQSDIVFDSQGYMTQCFWRGDLW
jgi:hypothetical protein